MGIHFGVSVGRYTIMPDHIHLFVRTGQKVSLGRWVKGLKRAVSAGVSSSPGQSLWQPGFFDHVLRSTESYREKSTYVLENPVRAGLVEKPDQWPYQGEIVVIDRA